jgi:hypothetical protein
MAHVTALAQHILTLDPDKDAARLCFYNYLKNLCEPAQSVNSELVNRFFCRALVFEHWQKNKGALFAEVFALLHHFSEATRQPFEFDGLMTAERVQVTPAENILVLEEVVSRYLERIKTPTDRFRVFQDSNERAIAVMLSGDQSLTITAFPKYVVINGGVLSPLCADFSLTYTPDLQISPKSVQQLDLGPHAAARFQMAADGIHGSIVRGYTFQKMSAIEGGGLHRYPVLFYPLKRLEQFFINRKTDSMYIELTSLLEKAIDMVSGQQPESQKFATTALERGRLALEHIYPDDKVVTLLIKNLEKTLALESARLATVQAATQRPTPRAPAGFDAPPEADGIDLVEAMAMGLHKNPNAKPPPASVASPKDTPKDKGKGVADKNIGEKWQNIRPLEI